MHLCARVCVAARLRVYGFGFAVAFVFVSERARVSSYVSVRNACARAWVHV